MARRAAGKLIIIGGHEDKDGDRLILRCVAEEVGAGKLVVATVASQEPGELWKRYEPVFRRLGVRHVHHLDVGSREDAKSERKLRVLDDAVGVFFTGGDQLRITSQLGDTPIYDRLLEIYESGGLVAGTSAGASVMCETMLVSGESETTPTVRGTLRMAPGLGLLEDAIVDQHFAERGRMGRLVGAVSQNPRMLGLGLDEDAAIMVEGQRKFTVLGTGAVYVVDGSGVSYSNLSDEESDRTLSIYDLRLHVLSQGDEFDLRERRPTPHAAEVMEGAERGNGKK
ncbi:MAG TPA: cyanophycinase [Gemmatimonadaceae bacterium]|nr:cyanophycinase [Gemmatimonadaceae bacterium]